MKMIYKVFLVIAILLICLIAWSMFLGDGGVLELAWNGIAKPVNASKVMICCPSCEKATRVKHEVKDGKKVRVCVKCGETIDV